MWFSLIYDGVVYDNFLINKDGEIKNVKTNCIYKHYLNKCGYIVVTLPMGSRRNVKVIRLHKAMAETFIPNPNKYKIVHHKDENKSNYSLDNLEWVTSKLNTQYHLQELKKYTPFFNNRKLTQEDIEYIRNNKDKKSYRTLSKMFNVSKTTIGNVVNNKFYVDGVW